MNKDKEYKPQEEIDNLKDQIHEDQNDGAAEEFIDDNVDQIDDDEQEQGDGQNNNEQELSQTDKLNDDLAREKDKFLRLFAEFENYKRRTSRERIELFKTANQDMMAALLPVLDDFDRAMTEIKKAGDKNLLKGVELIHNKFRETLLSKGLEPMDVKSGDSFDADVHEAITQVTAPSDKLKGKIVDVVERGYMLGEKIIRFPKVVTGK